MADIYKAYDIRGIYGKDLTEETAYAIGRAFVTFTACKKVVVARDIRPHSEPLFTALAKGLTEQGANVIDIGYGSTPMSYFANGTLGADASIMITASHNPAEWNGFKLCRAQAVPISGATGIKEIERIVNEGSFAPKAATPEQSARPMSKRRTVAMWRSSRNCRSRYIWRSTSPTAWASGRSRRCKAC